MESSWGSLVSSVGAFVATASGVPGAPEAYKVILALGGIEDEQAVMLRRIQREVALLRMGAFRSAQEHLRIAGRKGPKHSDYEYHLREAESLLFQAYGQSASAEEQSVVTFNLGLVEAVRGDAREGQNRLRESYNYCVTASRELITQASDLTVSGSQGTDALMLMNHFAAPVIAARTVIKTQRADQAAVALEGYVVFVNTVARVGNTMQGTATQKGLKLRKIPQRRTKLRRYELEWTGARY